MEACSPQGVRVTVPGESVTVYLDGKQVSEPASSCFIARVKRGDHRIEVRNSRGEVIYNEVVRCRKNRVEQIRLTSRTGVAKQLDKKKFDEVLKMIEQESFGGGKECDSLDGYRRERTLDRADSPDSDYLFVRR